MNLVELILRVDELLDQAGIPHAFGGALALGFVADPRSTADIDVNTFVPAERIGEVIDALAPLDVEADETADGWNPSFGRRLSARDLPFPIDVFVDLDASYHEVAERAVRRPFGPDGEQIPVLGAEDLAVFKLSFGRDKDWVDLRQIVEAVDLDLDYVERQLLHLRGPSMNPRLAKLRRLVRDAHR